MTHFDPSNPDQAGDWYANQPDDESRSRTGSILNHLVLGLMFVLSMFCVGIVGLIIVLCLIEGWLLWDLVAIAALIGCWAVGRFIDARG